MIRVELFVIAVGNANGVFDLPDGKAFKLKNPLLLRSYRPEKKTDSDHYRQFSSWGGGLKAACADVLAKSGGKNHRLSSENTLKDLLSVYGFSDERVARKIILFMQRAGEDSVTLNTKLTWLNEVEKES